MRFSPCWLKSVELLKGVVAVRQPKLEPSKLDSRRLIQSGIMALDRFWTSYMALNFDSLLLWYHWWTLRYHFPIWRSVNDPDCRHTVFNYPLAVFSQPRDNHREYPTMCARRHEAKGVFWVIWSPKSHFCIWFTLTCVPVLRLVFHWLYCV